VLAAAINYQSQGAQLSRIGRKIPTSNQLTKVDDAPDTLFYRSCEHFHALDESHVLSQNLLSGQVVCRFTEKHDSAKRHDRFRIESSEG